MDKFFSTEFFIFSNNDAIVEYVKDEFSVDEKDSYYKFLIFFLSELVSNNLITLRKLLKHKYKISFSEFTLFEKGFKVDGRWASGYPHWIESNNFLIKSNDLKILSFFRFFNSLFGEFSAFIKVLDELIKTQKNLNLEEHIDIIEFVALQTQLSKSQNLDVFILVHKSTNSMFVDGWNWPSIKFMSQNIHFQPQWTSGNKYDAQHSFYEHVNVHSDYREQTNKNEQVKATELFKAVKLIAENCFKYNYLIKAGISYSPSSA